MATAQPYILARTMAEAHSFARGDLGLPHGQYRIVNSAGTIKAVRGADLYLVPGYDKRFDRFQVKMALRWTRMNVIDATDLVNDEPDTVETDCGEQYMIVSNEEAADFILTTGVELTAAEPEVKTKRRSSRCKECGIMVPPDEREQHKEEHKSDLLSVGA